ncbi:hypothetical protein E2P81_ATG04883 [Venturia nashicola]|uniref:Uncharacterized protein n=1 Tax=Venturia nashicola TaxID=86259 RepID=A0A4Z1NZR7_9PEZI|nr:hypothetical protein E6O75_ATG05007 [Venturia nashicola]TLD34718.1 hypothetical protein E2P81_ATG04883 [Venturia nashicola]
MVLEGATGPQSDPYDNGSPFSESPSSDTDPYDSSSSAVYSIDFSALHRPMPIFGYVTGYSPPRFEKMIVAGIDSVSNRLNRQLSPEETQALASAYSKSLSYSSWGDGLGLIAGWARCYQKADEFKLPWGQDFRVKNPDILGPLRGATARLGWHAIRSIPYGLFGYFVLGHFTKGCAATVFMVTRSRDPALKLVDKQLTDTFKQQGGETVSPDTPTSDYGMIKEEADVPYDDMSPQAGNDGALLSDSEMRMEESRQQQLADAQRPKTVADRVTTQGERRDWDQNRGAKSGGIDPRADKPVNDPMYGMSAAERQASSGTTKESAWERLRREAAEKANK